MVMIEVHYVSARHRAGKHRVRCTDLLSISPHFFQSLLCMMLFFLSQCLFRILQWGRPSGVLPFRTSSFLTGSLCPSQCRRVSTSASSRHPSTSSHLTGLNITDNYTFSFLCQFWPLDQHVYRWTTWETMSAQNTEMCYCFKNKNAFGVWGVE